MVGNIYTARVENVVENIESAFLSVDGTDTCHYAIRENEGRHIFLTRQKKNKLSVGDVLLVQVCRAAQKTKKCEVTADLTLTGKYIVLNRTGIVGISGKINERSKREELKALLTETLDTWRKQCAVDLNVGVIIRTAAANADTEEIRSEVLQLLTTLQELMQQAAYRTCHTLMYKNETGYQRFVQHDMPGRYESFAVITDLPEVYRELDSLKLPKDTCSVSLFQDSMTSLSNVYRLNRELEQYLSRKIFLKSGGYLVCDVTEALTVIDVNTGKAIRGQNKSQHILKINKEAASKIAELLRIRNLSGIIIVDFINMQSEEEREELIQHLKKEIRQDRVKTNYVDMTPLGLVELTRKKIEKPLHEWIDIRKLNEEVGTGSAENI
jgi:ribonuclease G